MSTEQRLDLIITGRVQGVGFRYSAKNKADSLGINGHVRNQSDGSVFVTAQGEKAAINIFVQWCHQGPTAAIVHAIEKVPRTPDNFIKFDIIF
ncbi:MAG: acylphosphatase [SAR324 cluster bacterium]|nr:acylphosphatase [SAR324 cluster bacterium]MBL7035829.1 acylphosphatase [SAR324 cluster bacterium]